MGDNDQTEQVSLELKSYILICIQHYGNVTPRQGEHCLYSLALATVYRRSIIIFFPNE